MTPKVAQRYPLAQQQLADQLQLPLEHQLEVVTDLTVGLLHQRVEAKFHFHMLMDKELTSNCMHSGVQLLLLMRLPFLQSHLKAMALF